MLGFFFDYKYRMITFYADTIADNLTDPHITNRYLHQNITLNNGTEQDFTGHAQLDFSVFSYITEPVQFLTFDKYKPGQNVVAIGLHGGWINNKLTKIKSWFMSNPHRQQAWSDPNCMILLDYSEEGFTTKVFEDLWTWIQDNDLTNRVLYVTSSYNVRGQYKEWCRLKNLSENMRAAWYGFFPNWLLRDHGASTVITGKAGWNNNNRYMCLNRRPHPHRILLTTLLEYFQILDKGAVSLPKQFAEKEIPWKPLDWDIPYQWNILQHRANGYLEYLQPSFKQLYHKLPLVADTDIFSTNYALDLNVDFYQQYPINVISETLFFSTATFTSEKIWKPMLMQQIFFIMAAPYYLEDLHDMGFATFEPHIDESYDSILDPLERAHEMVASLKSLLMLSDLKFQQLLIQCQERVLHNKNLLYNSSRLEHMINHRAAAAIEQLWH